MSRSRRSEKADSYPARVGRYQLLLPIASGGMATVYLARARGLAGFEREVAVKLTHEHLRHTPGFISSLMDEARFAGRIRHANVVSVLDVGQDEHGVFIVMDYVEGDSLAGIVRTLADDSIRVPWAVGLRLLEDVLTGLHAAHELCDPNGSLLHLVHRDVSPHNILVGVDGVTRLTDFGIAKASHGADATRTGLIKGKLAYMSPEQARAEPVDRRCDVWAAGVVAWELLSGRRIHAGLGDAALLLKVAREAPTPLGHVVPQLPVGLADVVDHALRMRAQDRFPTAEAFADALASAARDAGISSASHREMRSFVLPLVSPRVERRRRKIAALDEGTGDPLHPADPTFDSGDSHEQIIDRHSGGDISAVGPQRPGRSSHSSVPAATPPPEPNPSQEFSRGATATVTEAASASEQTVWNGPRGAEPSEETATYGQGVEVSGQRPSFIAVAPGANNARSRRTLMLIGLVLAPLLLVVLAWALSSPNRRNAPAEKIVASPPPPAAPNRTAPAQAAPAPLVDPSSGIPIVEPSALPLIPSANTAAKRRPARLPSRAPAKEPKKPEPLRNPYQD